MKLNIKDINGKSIGDVSVDKDVFGVEPNLSAVRQAILSELNNMRQGTHSTKNRAMVNGGGKKPWKQKVWKRKPHGKDQETARKKQPDPVPDGAATRPAPRPLNASFKERKLSKDWSETLNERHPHQNVNLADLLYFKKGDYVNVYSLQDEQVRLHCLL